MTSRKINEPARTAFKTSIASLIPVYLHHPCMRLKNGMTARRTTTSMGTAVQTRPGSGIWNSKRSSHAHRREPTIRITCDPNTSKDRQRKRARDSLLLVLIEQIGGTFLLEDQLSGWIVK